MKRSEKLALVPPHVLHEECIYVVASTGWLSRVWRSAQAAWRCARIAARARSAP